MMSAHPIGVQIQYLLLEDVLTFSPGAVNYFVEIGRSESIDLLVICKALQGQSGYDKTRIVSLATDLCFTNDSP